MIRKLRRKFVVINMTIITIMLCAILGMIFCFTQMNLENESVAMMRSLPNQRFQPGFTAEREEPADVRLPYFVLFVDEEGAIVNRNGGYYDLTNDQALTWLVREAMERPDDVGVLKAHNLRYMKMPAHFGERRLVFADISSELATLNALTRTCVIIGVLGFAGFLAISVFLSKWAVKPVERAWKEQRQFVADASHELKTPLTVITTNAELLASPEYDEESRRRFSADILTMAHQMRGLVEQMLQLARGDAAEKKGDLSAIQLSTLVENAALPFEAVFFEKGLSLEVRTEPDIAAAGDEKQLRQLVEILLDNAQKYSSPGGATFVTLEKQGKSCLLTVQNEGTPIPAEELPNLFKRFYRADEARSRDGSFGLGLSIAESIAQQHGGKIWAESRDGFNCFYVELPAGL